MKTRGLGKIRVYFDNSGVYIYKKGILISFSNPITEKHHQIFVTGKYNATTMNQLYTVLAYLFDDINKAEVLRLSAGGYLWKPYNNRWDSFENCFNVPE